MQRNLVAREDTDVSLRIHRDVVGVVDRICVLLDVNGLRKVLRSVQVVQNDESPVAQSHDLVARVARIAPDLELVVVAAGLVEVLPLVEAQLLLPVIPTMVPVEEQVVVRRD